MDDITINSELLYTVVQTNDKGDATLVKHKETGQLYMIIQMDLEKDKPQCEGFLEPIITCKVK